MHEPCLFWLDAHYSAGPTAKGEIETPISVELDAALKHSVKEHVVLIDDARCFDGSHDYPAMFEIESAIFKFRPDLQFECRDDIIRITLTL